MDIPRNVDPQDALRLAAEVPCDPRTAGKAIVSGSAAVRGMTGYRIARAMARLGIPDPKPAIVVGGGGSSTPPEAA